MTIKAIGYEELFNELKGKLTQYAQDTAGKKRSDIENFMAVFLSVEVHKAKAAHEEAYAFHCTVGRIEELLMEIRNNQ